MNEKSTVNVNVKTNLIKRIRGLNPELADLKATFIVHVALKRWVADSIIKQTNERKTEK